MAQVSPSLFFWTYFLIFFLARILKDFDVILGGFWAPTIAFSRYFSLTFFGFNVQSIFVWFCVYFQSFETFKIMLPSRREHDFHKIAIFSAVQKHGPTNIVFSLQNRLKSKEIRRNKSSSKQLVFCGRLLLILASILSSKMRPQKVIVWLFFQSGAVEAPRGVQEALRRPQEGPKRAPRGSQEGPRRLPGGSKRALGTSLFEFFLDIFGFEVLHLSQAFWDLILEGLWPQNFFFGHICWSFF